MAVNLDVLKQNFDLKLVEEYFINDIPLSAVTLESLMLKGDKPEQWKSAAKTVGEFLAKFSSKTSLSAVPDTDRDRVLGIFGTSKPKLLTWLNETASDEESILKVLPEKQRQHADAIGLRRKADVARQLLSVKDCVSLQNATSNKIIIDASGKPKISSTNDYTIGPASLDAAIFLADMIINYYQMQTVHVEHSVQYKVVDICNDFGKQLDETAEKVKTGYDDKKYWKEVSLLTGWEILRRCHSLDRVKILAEENQFGGTADCMESGLRLIANDRISCVNFLLVVALMLAF